ncbi:MAG: HD domain-containing protein [Promethearchaeota archaeon]
MDLPYVKEIFDPIYSFIKLTKEEINVIDNLIFQRLHNINQLGTLHLVFPTARNTRFSHSLGVLAVTQKIIDNLKFLPRSGTKDIKKFNLEPNEQRLIRAAALMHDIGHLPFSHCTENVIKEYILKKYSHLKIQGKFHEWLGGEIIKKTNIYNPIEIYKRDIIITDHRENISQIINGSSKFTLFNQILNSELDADRIDYLGRDSYSTGVSFGLIDMDQILRKMFVEQRRATGTKGSDNIIVYSTHVINAIDNYYFARMFMYNSVYFHKVSRYFDFLLKKSYEIIINSDNLNEIKSNLLLKPDIFLEPILEDKELDEKEIQEFYVLWHQFDDHYVWNCMRDCWHQLKKKDNNDLSEELVLLKNYFDLLFQRKKSELVWEENRLKNIISNNNSDTKLDNLLERIFSQLEDWIKNELQKDYEFPLISLNHKVDAPLSNIEIDDPENLDDYEGESILFHDPMTDKFHYLYNVQSSINFQINKSEFKIFRVYSTKEGYRNELHEKIDKKFKELTDFYI